MPIAEHHALPVLLKHVFRAVQVPRVGGANAVCAARGGARLVRARLFSANGDDFAVLVCPKALAFASRQTIARTYIEGDSR